jgi:macrolide-specific efflux system membrane fusion protein
MRIADLTTMTVYAEVSEADVSKLDPGMDVYFTTLGSGDRRWYGNLRQILPTPVIENNVVLYTALFDVDNSDGALLSDMTAQIFFVTESARNVLKVPVGALTFATDSGRPASAARGFEGAGDDADRAARIAERRAQMTDEELTAMQERVAAGGQQRPAVAPGSQRGTLATVQVVVGPDDQLETRQIKVGVTSRISAEVLSGLEEGDRVVAGVIQSRNDSGNDNGARPFFR